MDPAVLQSAAALSAELVGGGHPPTLIAPPCFPSKPNEYPPPYSYSYPVHPFSSPLPLMLMWDPPAVLDWLPRAVLQQSWSGSRHCRAGSTHQYPWQDFEGRGNVSIQSKPEPMMFLHDPSAGLNHVVSNILCPDNCPCCYRDFCMIPNQWDALPGPSMLGAAALELAEFTKTVIF